MEPTSAVAEGLGHDVRLVAAGVESQLALVVVGLAVAPADGDCGGVLRAAEGADATRTTGAGARLRAVAPRVALELVAAARDRQDRVHCGAKKANFPRHTRTHANTHTELTPPSACEHSRKFPIECRLIDPSVVCSIHPSTWTSSASSDEAALFFSLAARRLRALQH
jgi:hypothetical protein